ncbi:hemolysin III family protein [uncultured Agrococcus sp.]|uniref:PAQR family membrane homeostasis protein TrhA n=1 Tax=uncultured Agrococcus sp. TaxID=382258 RepID=UPI0025FAD05A|nr:hemolysin III family protein [uncultured Agrococcus sp.]
MERPSTVSEPATPPAQDVKPALRGWIHAATVPLALLAGLTLVSLAPTPAARFSSAIFTAASVVLFGMSALYHRFNWGPKAKAALRRIDHANIFLLIAGTYTPMSVLALPPAKATLLLSLVWGGALLGTAARVFWVGAPRWVYVPLYVILGWAAVMYMGDLLAFSVPMTVLIIAGGVAYTVGALAYALKRPNPFPNHFGFHEIFHTLTVIAFGCHWAAVLIAAMQH